MNFLIENQFSFVRRTNLVSLFKGTSKSSSSSKISDSKNSLTICNPEDLFSELLQGKVELELTSMLALMGFDEGRWTSSHGRSVARNLWLSALEHDAIGQSTFYQLLVLRIVLSDTERYPGPQDQILVLQEAFFNLAASGFLKNKKNVDVVLVFASKSASKANDLAKIAFKINLRVFDLMKQIKLPTKLPIVKEADLEWFKIWLNSKETQRRQNGKILNDLLNNQQNLEDKQKFASIIFDGNFFTKSLEQLKHQISAYPEIVHWLSMCDRDQEFRRGFGLQQIQSLNCWVGSGNYQSLKKLLVEMTEHEAEDIETDLRLTENRYIFWNNYQHLFRESWLLVPQEIYENYESVKLLRNVKILHELSSPAILVRIGQYYILQMFMVRGNSVDLIIFDDVDNIEKLLNQNYISYETLKKLNISLIHDHLYKWQIDLAYTLDSRFKMKPSSRLIDITATMSRDYLKDVVYMRKDQDRNQAIFSWVRSCKNRWSSAQIEKSSLTAQRYK